MSQPSKARRMAISVLALMLLVAGTPRVETRHGKKTVTNAPAAGADTLNVLFIGNSLTYFNEMPWILEQVAASRGAKPPLRAVFSGGSGMSMKQHWERGRALRTLREGRWDYVVLQPQSAEIVRDAPGAADYVRRFDAEIRKAKARTVIFSTWATLTSGFKQSDLDKRYATLARELGALLAPVGPVWHRLRSKGLELFDGSGVHANLAGSYLSACVFYSLFYNRSPSGAQHRFDVKFEIPEFYRQSLETERIDWATAESIQRAAWDEVRQR